MAAGGVSPDEIDRHPGIGTGIIRAIRARAAIQDIGTHATCQEIVAVAALQRSSPPEPSSESLPPSPLAHWPRWRFP